MMLYFIDNKWTEVFPTQFTVNFYSKEQTEEDVDAILVEYNDGELSLFGSVKDFESILYKMLKAVNENKEDA